MKKALVAIGSIVAVIAIGFAIWTVVFQKNVLESKSYMYLVEGDQETLLYYTIEEMDMGSVTSAADKINNGTYIAENVIKMYSAEGKLLKTSIVTDSLHTEYTDAYEQWKYKDSIDELLGASSLVGTGSDDLIYESYEDDKGYTHIIYDTKSGKYPRIHSVVEYSGTGALGLVLN